MRDGETVKYEGRREYIIGLKGCRGNEGEMHSQITRDGERENERRERGIEECD